MNTVKIFENEEINTGRQTELDIAKGVAIFIMVLCHALLTLWTDTDSFWYILGDSVLGGPPAAPVFMICLGIGTCYSRYQTPVEVAKRGLRLVGIAYAVNFIRDVLPYIIWSVHIGEISGNELLEKLLDVDILQFAGVALLVIALMKKIPVQPILILVLSVILNIIGHAMTGMTTGHVIADGIFGLLWPTGEITSFPLLNWMIFPAFGICFGKLLIRCREKNRFYLTAFVIGAVMAISYLLFGSWSILETRFYHLGLFQAVFCIGACLMFFAVDYVLAKVFGTVLIRLFTFISEEVDIIYCIHWVIIGWMYLLLCEAMGIEIGRISVAIILGVIIFVVSAMLAKWFRDFRESRQEQTRG